MFARMDGGDEQAS
jgi:hypothetical protein